MSNLNNNESIYHELKEFYDTNPGVLYSYQDFQIAGAMEFKVLFNKVRPLKEYEKNRFAYELLAILEESIYEEINLSKIEGYLTLNPIINYYENFIRLLKALKNNDPIMFEKIEYLAIRIVSNSASSEEIKFGLIISSVCNIRNINEILDVFSIHNDYIFYVIKVYEEMKNSNSIIFELAKKSKGYGKVFCVRALQPINYEIKSWMIKNGSEDNVVASELLEYSMLSLDLLDYLEKFELDEKEVESFSKAFSSLLSEYGLDEINDGIKLCKKLVELINIKGNGIYSLYAAISIMYSIETLIQDDYKSDKEFTSDEFNKQFDEYEEIAHYCELIYQKPIWNSVISDEISNIDSESSIIIASAENTEYNLKTNEFEMLLKRDYRSPLLYRYAFSAGNKFMKKLAFKIALEKLSWEELLNGQDEVKIDEILYEEVEHVCLFVIIKNVKYEDFPKEYKKLNLDALKSPIIETRMHAVSNLGVFRAQFDSLDEQIIKDSIKDEIVDNIREQLSSLLLNKKIKEIQYVEVKDVEIDKHVKDIYLTSVNIAGTRYVDMKEVNNNLYKRDMLYLKRDINNSYDINAIQVITTEGYVLGYIQREINVILKSLIDNGKYIYGIVENLSDDYEEIGIKIYLSYKDTLDEIATTLSLLSREKEDYVQ